MENSKNKQDCINSLMPLGVIVGCATGSVVGIFWNSGILLYSIAIGSGLDFQGE